MNNSLVSILIPVYNRETIVATTIESALRQTYKNIEIIIVDNHSTDGTWRVLQGLAKNDRRIKIYQNASNIGPVRNWKRCLDFATGRFTKILFSDDLISENFIEKSIEKMFDDVAFIISKVIIFDNDSNKIIRENHSVESVIKVDKYLEDVLLTNRNSFPVSPGAAFFRTEDLRKSYKESCSIVWGLDFSRFGAGNDLWFFLQTAIHYKKIIVQPKAIAYFRSHNGSFTSSNNLALYYEIAKFEFQEEFVQKYLSRFKSIILLKYIKSKKFKNLYNRINEKFDFLFLVRILVSKIFLSIKKIL